MPVPFSQLRSIIAAGLAGSVLIAPLRAGEPPAPTITDPNRFAVTNPGIVRSLFSLADSRRIDFAIIGDSNVRNSVISGHEDGMARALSARFGCYATRVDPFIGLASWAAAVGGAATFGYAPFQFDTAPPIAAQFALPPPWYPNAYAYLPAGINAPDNYNGGLRVEPTHPIGIENALRYHATMYRWRTPTTGRLAITIRKGPHDNIAAGAFGTAAAAPGLVDVHVDAPPGPRHPVDGVMCAPGNLVDNIDTRGPFFGLWQRVEAPGTPTGISYSPLLYQGGRSARAACIELNSIGPASPALREWLRQVTRLQQHPDPVLCIQILHGGNDAGDDNPSVGPVGGIRSSTALGHADNLRGIINNLRAAWIGMGRDPSGLYFILGPYHPRGDRLALQREFEQQWVALAAEYPNTIAIRGTELSTEQEFIQLGWMLSSTDFAHLSVAGYRGWGIATVEAMQRAACPADITRDRLYTVGDIFGFLEFYFGSDPHADFDGSGALSVQDIFNFLESYFRGC